MATLDKAQILAQLQSSISVVRNFLVEALKNELHAQGHVNTGALANSIEGQIKQVADVIVLTVWMNDYWINVNRGVGADKIPYSPGSGAGSSNYIQGLIDFFMSKGLQFDEARGAAFATANAHKREGMPTKGSYRFSDNGRRLGFVDHTIAEEQQRIDELLTNNTFTGVEKAFYDFLGRVAQENGATIKL